jgi:pimeloyl-ACP methyl ester carboxylesterase
MVKYPCYDIHIQTAQWDGAGKTLLAVHGITANCMAWKTLASSITPQHRLIAMDLRGRGLSDKPRSGYSINHHIRDIECLLDTMGIKEVVIIGHSLGAYIAVAFAALYPQKAQGLILVDGGASLSPKRWEKIAEVLKPSKERLGKVYPSEEHYLSAMKALSFYHPWNQAKTDYFKYEMVVSEGSCSCGINPAHIQEEAVNVRDFNVEDFYPKISCNTLILQATDGLVSSEDVLLPDDMLLQTIANIPSSYAVKIQGANHYSILFDPFEERDAAIRDYLSRV